jgi:gluconate kinase
MVTVKQFFDVTDSYVALVQSETKGKHFFRADKAQAKFRDLENVQNAPLIVSLSLSPPLPSPLNLFTARR